MKLQSGIFGKVSGSVSGLTFQRARTPQGVKSVAREKVIPARAETETQKRNRAYFANVQRVISETSDAAYNPALSNMFRGLTAKRALTKFYLSGQGGVTEIIGIKFKTFLATKQSVKQGDLYMPRMRLEVTAFPFTRRLFWSTELKGNAKPTDLLYYAVREDLYSPDFPGISITPPTQIAVRFQGQAVIPELPSGQSGDLRKTILAYFLPGDGRQYRNSGTFQASSV